MSNQLTIMYVMKICVGNIFDTMIIYTYKKITNPLNGTCIRETPMNFTFKQTPPTPSLLGDLINCTNRYEFQYAEN